MRHFKIAPPEGAPAMLGVIGGTAEWIFAFADRISVTVSGADAIVDMDREELAAAVVARRGPRLRPHRVLAALADRQGEARDFRRHAGAGSQASGGSDALAQSVPGRGLDRYRPSGHHRKRRALGPRGCAIGAGVPYNPARGDP